MTNLRGTYKMVMNQTRLPKSAILLQMRYSKLGIRIEKQHIREGIIWNHE